MMIGDDDDDVLVFFRKHSNEGMEVAGRQN